MRVPRRENTDLIANIERNNMSIDHFNPGSANDDKRLIIEMNTSRKEENDQLGIAVARRYEGIRHAARLHEALTLRKPNYKNE